jgi:hypothetical protein
MMTNSFIDVLDNCHESQLQPSKKQQYKKYSMKYKGYKDKRQIYEETDKNKHSEVYNMKPK